MAKQANRMMIGGFVVLAVAILATSLVVFGSGKFFRKTNTYVLFFDESVKGLSVGAPVLFQGVQVGSVTNIVIQADFKQLKAHIPVFIEIEPGRFQVSESQEKHRDPRMVAQKLIEAGLRAMLAMQSLITGQLLIELDFFPNTPVVLRNLDKEAIELPTIPSTTARLARALEKIDLTVLQQKLESALSGVDKFVNDPDLMATVRDLRETMQSTRKLVARLDKQVEPLAKNMKNTIKSVGKLAQDFDPRMKELSANLEKTLSTLNKTLVTARGAISEDAPLMVDLENTLRELAAMSRAVREFTSFLDQQPESLIRGRKPSGDY